MASFAIRISFQMLLFLFTSQLLFSPICFCFYQGHFPSSATRRHWFPAGATWYGEARGDGSEGGACGYGNAVGLAPFSSMIAAGGPSLFKSGKGCGACYQVRCTHRSLCSSRPVSVVMADECPGCLSEAVHFDLSGTAFGAMALPGKADELRNAGLLPIQFSRVPCEYEGRKVAFHVDVGSNPYYFSVVIEFEDGDGDLAAVSLQELQRDSLLSNEWMPMQQSWGANWMLSAGYSLQAPFSIRLTSLNSGEDLVAPHVIPAGWTPGATYYSLVNYGY
ncbi:unnamed protein product [Victoria cruziana]